MSGNMNPLRGCGAVLDLPKRAAFCINDVRHEDAPGGHVWTTTPRWGQAPRTNVDETEAR